MTSARLILLSPAYRGQEFELTRETYTCGRLRDQEICIPDVTVSSHHCDFIRSEDGATFAIRDAGSTNGTKVNGAPVTNEDVVLYHADVVVIGSIEALYECQSARRAGAAKVSTTTKISIDNDNMQKTIPMLPNMSLPMQEPEQAKNNTSKLFILIIALLAVIVVILAAVVLIKVMGNA